MGEDVGVSTDFQSLLSLYMDVYTLLPCAIVPTFTIFGQDSQMCLWDCFWPLIIVKFVL